MIKEKPRPLHQYHLSLNLKLLKLASKRKSGVLCALPTLFMFVCTQFSLRNIKQFSQNPTEILLNSFMLLKCTCQGRRASCSIEQILTTLNPHRYVCQIKRCLPPLFQSSLPVCGRKPRTQGNQSFPPCCYGCCIIL